MGIMARHRAGKFLIASDCDPKAEQTRKAPKKFTEQYHVWTGDHWSETVDEAKVFVSIEDADEYLRENYSTISKR